MKRLSSSLRRRSAEETLYIVENGLARSVGITRVTDTTWLDKIGIPVFASIRPAAMKGSLCVNAGKGLRVAEAKIGAYMEAIEFSLAEFNTANLEIIETTPRLITKSQSNQFKFQDLCMLHGFTAIADAPIMAVEVEDLKRNKPVLIPAELVFIPYSENPRQRLFGESSNGLASGNDLMEATIHATCELLERDVQAFNFMHDQSQLVTLDVCSETVLSLIEKIHAANLELSIRYTRNCFGSAYFQAFIMEESPHTPVSVASGSGFHPIKEIALIRAICEAAQSRLSHIHGGRDDIIERVKYFYKKGRKAELDAVSKLRSSASMTTNAINYSLIPCHEPVFDSIEQLWDFLIKQLQLNGMDSVLRADLSKSLNEIKVVRIIIPGLESFEPGLKRIGPRLTQYVKNID